MRLKIYKSLLVKQTSSRDTIVDENKSVEKITLNNVQDGKSFDSKETIQSFIGFLKRNQTGFYCYHVDSCVCRAWLFNVEDRCYVGQDFLYKIANNEQFIAWCETDPNQRRILSFISH
jgi:hypothetical protein